MADNQERLIVSLEARVAAFERNFQRASRTASNNWSAIEKRGKTAATRMESDMAKAVGGINRTLAGIGVGLSIAGAVKLIDASTRITNALKVAGVSGEQLNKVYDSLFASAQRNAAPLEALVQLFGRASLVQKELGISTQDLLRFTDNVAVALRVNGKSAQESSGALLQLSQALGSGTVRAEEFNSLLEGALPIAQAAAAGIEEAGGSVAKLRKMVVDGQISSKAFFLGFQAGAAMLQTKVANAQLTVSQGFVRLENAAIDAAKRINEATGASKTAASALDALAFIVDKLANAFINLSRIAAESHTAAEIDNLGAAARNLWNDPSFQNLYEFLFDASGSSAKAAAADAISERAKGFEALATAMRKANVESEAAKKAKSDTTPSRFDEAFAAFAPKKIKASDYPADAKKKDDSGDSRDAFDRQIAQIQKHIDLLGVEASTINQSVAARERARAVVQLETAARRANQDTGKSDIAVTDEQRKKIDELATAYGNVQARLETLHGPLQSFMREANNINFNLENLAAQGLNSLSNELADVVMNTKTAGEAFQSMANLIIRELIRIALQKAISGVIGSVIGGPIVGIVGGVVAGARASGGPVDPGRAYVVGEKRPELFVPRTPGTIIPKVPTGGNSLTQTNTFNINVSGGAGTPDQNSDLSNKIGQEVHKAARQMVTRELRTAMRPGGMLYSQRAR
jgi:tape measure domain-containing protein